VQYELREEGTQARRERLTGNRGIDEGLPEWILEFEGDTEGCGRLEPPVLEGAEEAVLHV